MRGIQLLVVLSSIWCRSFADTPEDQGVKYADSCEVCKVLATELENRLDETGKTSEVLEIGYSVDDVRPKKKKSYQKSELRLVESLEGLCERILEYNIHKERSDSTRFAKGMSQTFKTLHGLVDKGVKVDLGIPYDLWDKPSAEVVNMKAQCESVLENYEEDIEEWYFQHQGKTPLKTFLCREKVLRDQDSKCLDETVLPPGESKGDQSAITKKEKTNEEL